MLVANAFKQARYARIGGQGASMWQTGANWGYLSRSQCPPPPPPPPAEASVTHCLSAKHQIASTQVRDNALEIRKILIMNYEEPLHKWGTTPSKSENYKGRGRWSEKWNLQHIFSTWDIQLWKIFKMIVSPCKIPVKTLFHKNALLFVFIDL